MSDMEYSYHMNYADTLLSGEPIVLDSGKVGPRVVILCSVHGNEPCGVEALKKLLPTLNLEKGTLTCILANPKAYAQNVRFTEANLNRVFSQEENLTDEEKKSYEYERSKYLSKFLKASDYLLDLHSVTDTDCQPFVICSANSFDIAKQIDTNIILSGLYEIHSGSTDGFMNSLGKYAICVECGQHADPQSIIFAEASIKRFLSILGMTTPIDFTPNKEIKYAVAKYMYRTKTNFIPSREYKNFDPIKKGEVIGTDGGRDISSPYDGFIIFCHKKDKPKEEAFVLGEYLE